MRDTTGTVLITGAARRVGAAIARQLAADGWNVIPVVILVITATSNAVNLTDGLDGLAIGIVGIVGLTLAVISYISGNTVLSGYLTIPFLRGNGELVVYCAAMVGAALGFLWFNAYPAQVFPWTRTNRSRRPLQSCPRRGHWLKVRGEPLLSEWQSNPSVKLHR